MSFSDDVKLENCDPDDVVDVLVKLERSFNIKFRQNAFENVKTFGEICDVIESHIERTQEKSCTSQQAFYKVRKAIAETLLVNERAINLSDRMDELFPRRNRKHLISTLKQNLNIKLDMLSMRGWLSCTIIIGFLISIITFFINWQIALSGLVFFYMFTKIAELFSKEMRLLTVREFTEEISRENYAAVRRNGETVNTKEIFATIQNTFSADLALDKSELTREAILGWQ